jgi:hypothetical protein
MGTGDAFDGAIVDFSETYAGPNEKDYAASKAAITAGRVTSSGSTTGREAIAAIHGGSHCST